MVSIDCKLSETHFYLGPEVWKPFWKKKNFRLRNWVVGTCKIFSKFSKFRFCSKGYQSTANCLKHISITVPKSENHFEQKKFSAAELSKGPLHRDRGPLHRDRGPLHRDKGPLHRDRGPLHRDREKKIFAQNCINRLQIVWNTFLKKKFFRRRVVQGPLAPRQGPLAPRQGPLAPRQGKKKILLKIVSIDCKLSETHFKKKIFFGAELSKGPLHRDKGPLHRDKGLGSWPLENFRAVPFVGKLPIFDTMLSIDIQARGKQPEHRTSIIFGVGAVQSWGKKGVLGRF